ncbi:MAG TPA: hypothetical protein VFS08_08950 [Gemmatimonadaceae bacterium]|nr:hypothetical protein [Gemmatimonadaceae bacterium]
MSRSSRRRGGLALAVAGALAAAGVGCADRQSAPPVVSASGAPVDDAGRTAGQPGARADSGRAAGVGSGTRDVFAVQVAAFADSAAARRHGDSLAAEGWGVLLRYVPGDTLPPWRVRVAPTQDRVLAMVVVGGFAALRQPVQVVRDTATLPATRVIVQPVNRGAHGERAEIRWTSPADRSALLVTEDPVARGGEPMPDGFLLASERTGIVLQRDSVWDVAPDPAWRRVAFGRAFVVSAVGRQALSARDWLITAARMNLRDFTAVQRAAFPIRREAPIYGVAQPAVEPLEPDPERSELVDQALSPIPMFGGWRVRWMDGGRTLGVGLAPEERIADDAPPDRWMILDPVSRLVRGELRATGRLQQIDWTAGPVIDIATRFAPQARRFAVEGGVVESRDGWIRVTSRRTGGRPRVLGPGTPLAVTRRGDFVLALAPVLQARPEDPLVQFVVYQLVS